MGSKKIQISHVVILPELNKAFKNEVEIRLEPKIMAVLMYLIEHRHKVVSQDILVQTIWPETVVGKEVITRAIFELRKLFDDDAKQPRFIETIPRKGYCFIHDIEVVEQPKADPKHQSSSIAKPALILTISLFVVLATWFLLSMKGSEPEPSERTVIPYSGGMARNKLAINDTATSLGFVLSPQSSNASQAHVIDMTNLHQSPLATAEPSVHSLEWLNTLQTWGYVRCYSDNCNVYTRKEQGSPELLLYQQTALVREVVSHSQHPHLMLVSSTFDGGQLTVINESNTELLHQATFPKLNIERAVFTTASTQVYFSARDSNQALQLYQYDWQTEHLAPLDIKFDAIRGLTVHQQDLVVSGKYQSQEAIWRVKPNEARVTLWQPAQSGEVLYSPVVAKDDNLFYLALKRDTKILAFGLDQATLIEKADSNGVEVKGVYLETAEALLTVSNRTGSYEIWQSDKAGIRRVSHLEADLIAQPQLSPTESMLAFVIQKNGQFQLYLMDTRSHEMRRTYASETQFVVEGWMDQNTLLLSTNKKSQRERVYQTLNQRSSAVKPLREGRYKFVHNLASDYTDTFVLAEDGALMSIHGNDDAPAKLSLRGLVDFDSIETLAIHQQQLYVSVRGNPKRIMRIALPTLEQTVVAELPANGYVSQIGITGSGERQRPFVIYDQLQADVTQIISHRL